ncbi:MAG TPA: ECF-type sigma factor, partial [Chthoniobacterales bacterium]|nr:ECF-type sigma factor [Chthoniobacterales bacterium]
TRLLDRVERGDPQAADELLPLVYDELRKLAAAKMAGEQPGQTLQATALVHEAWMRLAGENHSWQNRRHFFSAAAEAMRRILVERARRRGRLKRGGGGHECLPLDEIDVAIEADDPNLLRVHEALEKLAKEDPVKAELVKLRFFAGLRIPEAAELLGLSGTTAKRYWTYARAWLYDDLTNSG